MTFYPSGSASVVNQVVAGYGTTVSPAGGTGIVTDTTALTSAAGNIGADVPLALAAATTVITTAALAIGTWLIMASITVANGNATPGTAEITLVAGSGSSAPSGALSSEAELPGVVGETVQLVLFARLAVTVAGTFNVQINAPGAAASTAKAATVTNAYAQASGYTALRIA